LQFYLKSRLNCLLFSNRTRPQPGTNDEDETMDQSAAALSVTYGFLQFQFLLILTYRQSARKQNRAELPVPSWTIVPWVGSADVAEQFQTSVEDGPGDLTDVLNCSATSAESTHRTITPGTPSLHQPSTGGLATSKRSSRQSKEISRPGTSASP